MNVRSEELKERVACTMRLRKYFVPSLVVPCLAVGLGYGQQTHRFTPETYYNTFSFAHPPVLRINPGDRVITQTVDALGIDAQDRSVAAFFNPQTGPFYVEGAEPGDTLVVTLNRIEPSRDVGYSLDLVAPYALDPDFLRAGGAEQRNIVAWDLDRESAIARLSTDESAIRRLREQVGDGLDQIGIGARAASKPIEVPLLPMLGCVATAPGQRESVATSTPGPFGGNMDYAGMVEGVKVMLPVFEPGALLFIGDGHARQGHGEVVGTGIEVSMDVEFTVELIKGRTLRWPRLENDEYIMVLGSARPLLQALQHATTDMQSWLTSEYGYDERTSSLLMGNLLEYEIANVVDPHFTVVAKIRKADLERQPE